MSQATGDTDSNTAWLKPDQVESMRDAAYQGNYGQRDDALITLLYDTGLRRGELAQVDRSMVDLDEGELRIPGRIQKDYPNDNSPTRKTFELDLEGELRTVRSLRSYLNTRDDESTALFPSRESNRMWPNTINRVVKRAAERASVRPQSYEGQTTPDDVSAHTLRHSVAYRLLHEYDDYTMYDVRNRLRHATILTTERKYDHFDTI